MAFVGAGARNFRNKVLQHDTYHGMPRMLEAIYQAIRDGSPLRFRDIDMIDAARLIDRLAELEPSR